MASKTPKKPIAQAPSTPATQTEYLRALTQILQEEELSELEIENAGLRITLKAPEPVQMTVPSQVPFVTEQPFAMMPVSVAAAPTATDAAVPLEADSEEELIKIISPMVGIFYRAPSPSDPNFVEVGDRVEAGQTVALIEAMKVFNEIVAESAGTVIDIKAQSSDLIETGGTLMTLCPHQVES